jgi:type IV secretion system protein TrbL
VWFIANWPMLVDKLGRTFMQLGLKAGGFTDTSTYTSEPGNILYLCYNTIQPIIDQITRLCASWSFYKNLGQILFLGMSVVAIVAAFFIITIQVALAIVTFKFGSLASFVLIPFGVLSKTAFIAERPLGWVVGSGIRLMVLTLVLGIANGIFTSLAPASGSTVSVYEAFTISLAALLLAMFSLTASRLATDLVIGGPSLGAGTMVNQTAVAYQATHRTVTRPAFLAAQAASAISSKGLSTGKAAVNGVAGSFVRMPGGQPRTIFKQRVEDTFARRPSPASQKTA